MNRHAFVALGTNLPHDGHSGAELLAFAVGALRLAGLPARARSSVWRSPAWPSGGGQPDYSNAVVALDPAGRAPEQLFAVLLDIERRFGRERRERWGARTLDLDIIAMSDLVGVFEAVQLPHPRMHERGFVLAPLGEIAPDWRHPVLGLSVAQMLENAPDRDATRRKGALEERLLDP